MDYPFSQGKVAMDEKWSFQFRILVKRQDDLWVAHCLELDLVAAAPTEEQAHRDMADIILEQVSYCIANDNMDHLFRSAPTEVWEEYRACEKQMKPVVSVFRAPPKGTVVEDYPPISFIASACRSPLGVCHA